MRYCIAMWIILYSILIKLTCLPTKKHIQLNHKQCYLRYSIICVSHEIFDFCLVHRIESLMTNCMPPKSQWVFLYEGEKDLFCTFSVNIGKKRQTDYDGFRRKSAARRKTTYAIAWASDSIIETRFVLVRKANACLHAVVLRAHDSRKFTAIYFIGLIDVQNRHFLAKTI